MNLRIIASGGTFDKHYDEISGKLGFGSGHLTEIIKRARFTMSVSLEELPFLDSLEMQNEDRQRILTSCKAAKEASLVIIHGTDTMRETAEVLGHAKLNKSIVLTGSMIPYEIAHSDALFNFGFACAAVQLLPPGAYVTMNGKVFEWDKVEKNRTAGVFQVP